MIIVTNYNNELCYINKKIGYKLKRILYILIYLSMLSIAAPQNNCEIIDETGNITTCDWSFNIMTSSPNPQNNEGQQCYTDNIVGGMCETCYDGFQYGEDKYDIGGAGTDCFTDVYFVNVDWLGDEDNHIPPITCDEYKFGSDIRGLHSPSDLLVWNVNAGQVNTDQNIIKFEWTIEDLPISGHPFSDYDIYLYIGETKINMKETSSTYISTSDLGYIPDGTFNDNGNPNYTTNVKIYMGGCAADGLTTFYPDEDGDGLGASNGEFSQFCMGFEPAGWSDNNLDIDDSIFCESNNIDSCNICDGNNSNIDCSGECFGDALIDSCGICSGGTTGHSFDSDIDCSGECFGDALIDSCGICSGGTTGHSFDSDIDCSGECFGDALIDSCGDCNGQNLSCLDTIFGDGPINLYALINNNSVHITWDYNDIESYEDIEMFEVVYTDNNITETIGYVDRESSYEIYSLNYIEGVFCVAGIDMFGNKEDYTCTESTVEETFVWTLHNSANMISFPVLPNNLSVSEIFSSLTELNNDTEYSLKVIGAGQASTYIWNQEQWVGNISDIDTESGYYLYIDLEQVYNDPEATISFSATGTPLACNDITHQLSQTTFISFQNQQDLPITDAISDDFTGTITQVIGEGLATAYIPGLGWVGALTTIERGKSYWIRTSLSPEQEINFQWNCSD